MAWWQLGVWWRAAKHADATSVVVWAVLLRQPFCRLGPYVWSMRRHLMIGRCIAVAFCTLARSSHERRSNSVKVDFVREALSPSFS